MRNFILPFLLILTIVFSCRSEDYGLLEKKVNSYDVYVGGTENLQVCFWKNNQKTIMPGGDNLNGVQIEVDNNDVYVLAVNIEHMDQIRAWYFWKNGVKYNVAQYLNVAANNINAQDNLLLLTKMIVMNGDIYFAGTMKNPNPTSSLDQHQICYWKNGVKTIISNSSEEAIAGFEVYNNDVYIATRKNFNFTNLSWDTVHYKNGIQNSIITSTTKIPQGYSVIDSDLYILTKDNQNGHYIYKSLNNNLDITIPVNVNYSAFKTSYFENADKYYMGENFYYKNNNLVQINDPNGFNQIGHLLAKDQNIYMTRTKNSVVKFFINNVDTMTITDTTKGCFNDIFVVQN
ncbi:MAG: hypothetical protein EOO44_19565 [Flavobacterium sp.]|nr:MAG: hypothetical protein EOO44_19565 [Flavobacterium sp.]